MWRCVVCVWACAKRTRKGQWPVRDDLLYTVLLRGPPPGHVEIYNNCDRVGHFHAPSDGFYQGARHTDEAVRELCALLGWKEELDAVLEQASAASV